MCKVYGYCRVSTQKQSIERQRRNIKAAYPDAILVEDEYTGMRVEGRRGFEKLLSVVRPGDSIVFDSVSRMSRNAEEGFALYERLYKNGVDLVFLKERHIDTATYKNAVSVGVPLTGTNVDFILEGVNKYLMALAKEQIRLAFEQSEKEVADLRQRTREGIETARLEGKQIGQEAGRKLHVKKADRAKELIKKHSISFGGSLNDIECIKQIGIARGTYYKYKRELHAARDAGCV